MNWSSLQKRERKFTQKSFVGFAPGVNILNLFFSFLDETVER
jgi:hypothetical protein